jgi:S-adenosylmethionine-diacylgycerolhomoserine-N-methlytransferase
MGTFRSNLNFLYHLFLKPVRENDHAARMEAFYGGQADGYDRFRRRLLSGRRELYASIPVPQGGVWVDMGAGTGANLEAIGQSIGTLRRCYVVDLSASMLSVARRRVLQHGWTNVETVQADVTQFTPAAGEADVVTFSYSLTMVPDWIAALENAAAMLKPGGTIGVVDFYVSRKHPCEGMRKHSWSVRTWFPIWCAAYNVFLSPDHLPFLRGHFQEMSLTEGMGRVGWMPLVRIPYFTFLGKKRSPQPLTPS